MTPLAAPPLAEGRSVVTRLPDTVTPGQFCTNTLLASPSAAVPQTRKNCSAATERLAGSAAQLFCRATRAMQSSARSLLAPDTLG